MKTLVIGGSGFIGTGLVQDLIAQEHEVLILDRATSERFGAFLRRADVRDLDAVRQAAAGVDAIYLLAAEHHDNIRPVSRYHEVNVGGAENTVRAAEEAGVRRIVFTSSAAVYGLSRGVRDEATPTEPFNEYGRSKLEAEAVLKEWAASGDRRSLMIVRPTVVFGEGNRGNVHNLIRQIADRRFVMVGDGRNRKSMCYVGNLVPFLIQALAAEEGVTVCNYVDKPDLDMNRLVSLVREEISGARSPPARVPYWLGLMGGYLLDTVGALTRRAYPVSAIRVKKFCSETRIAMRHPEFAGDSPPFTLEEGLRRTIRSVNST